jgi:hypothetical protein
MRLGLISNLRSQRNKRGIAPLRELVAGREDVLHRELEGIDGLPEALAEFAAAEVNLLAINGGDGTVQAVASLLINRPPFDERPPLAVLSGGMTNMIAEDVGRRGKPAANLRQLLLRLEREDWRKRLAERAMVGMRLTPEAAPVYGTFFGTSAIYRAILYTRRAIHPMKVESNLAAGIALARLLLGRAFGGGATERILEGEEIAVTFGDGAEDSGRHLLSLVTGMERLILHSRPFWGEGTGALHYTRISDPAPRLLRNGCRLLYGGADREPRPREAYFSRKADSMSFNLSQPFTLDGELFTPEPGVPVALSGDQRIAFLRY